MYEEELNEVKYLVSYKDGDSHYCRKEDILYYLLEVESCECVEIHKWVKSKYYDEYNLKCVKVLKAENGGY